MTKREFVKTMAAGTAAAAGLRLVAQTPTAPGAPFANPPVPDNALPAPPPLHICTRESAPWQTQAAPEALGNKPAEGGAAPDLVVTDETTVAWQGFGGCFNELGWRALQHLPPEERAAVLDRLFRPDGELCFQHCRLPVGANDYSEDWYSYAENPGDFELASFSIARDRRALLPFIRAALARQPALTLFASPWSPPTWLKVPPVYNSGRLNLEPRYLDTYARYLLKFVEAYAAEGVKINQLHVQNEPVAAQKFPSCVITGDELRVFIGQHLGPTFAAANCPAEIWLGTLNGPENEPKTPGTGFNDYAFAVMEDSAARRFVRGISYQWAGKSVVWRTRLAYPQLPVIQSENECGDGANSWLYAWYVADLFYHYLANDVSAYCYWNMVLEPRGVSTWGWAQNSLLTVDPARRTVRVNPEYHIMRHYSAFIRRGDRRCRCQQAWAANAVAYRGPERRTTVVLRNPLTEDRMLRVACNGGLWQVRAKAESLNTLVFA